MGIINRGTPRRTKDKEVNSLSGGFIKSDPGANHLDVKATHASMMYQPKEADRIDAEARLNDKDSPLERFVPKWPKRKLGKRGKLATLGLSKQLVEEAPPRLMECIKNADKFRRVRSREYAVSHGYVSAGVSSLLATSSLALAASRYLFDEFARTGDIELLQLASKLSTDARVNELAGWELCAREAVARRKASASNASAPWLEAQPEKRKRGRPKKVVAVVETQPIGREQPAAGTESAQRAVSESSSVTGNVVELCGQEPVDDSFPFSPSGDESERLKGEE